jgi:hypothetical protein
MKKIEWLFPNEEYINLVPKPKPAHLYVPQWYKQISKFENKKFDFFKNNLTIKSCVPFLESLTMGYIQETWCDINIERDKDNNISYGFSIGPEIISMRNKISSDKLLDKKIFYEIEFTWRLFWIPKLPKGYSMLYTHPLNRNDLPFQSLSGIIDSDVFYDNKNGYSMGGNYPFYIKKDFEGIIPAGTPMYQMIPIKRNRWLGDDGKLNPYNQISPRKFFYNGYKKLYWQRKEYK